MRLIRSVRRHWVRWTIGAVAVVAAVVVGGPFLFFHVIDGAAPAPLRLSDGSAPSAADGSPTNAQASGAVWKVADGSQAGYRVQETLFGQSHTAVGRTSAVTGSVTVSGATVTAADFSVDLTKVRSDQSIRDGQFQGRIMDTADYPTATLSLSSPIRLATMPAEGVTTTEQARAKLTMHGVTRPVSFAVYARRSASVIQLNAAIPITFADWNIANPSGGPASTADHGILEVLINLALS